MYIVSDLLHFRRKEEVEQAVGLLPEAFILGILLQVWLLALSLLYQEPHPVQNSEVERNAHVASVSINRFLLPKRSLMALCLLCCIRHARSGSIIVILPARKPVVLDVNCSMVDGNCLLSGAAGCRRFISPHVLLHILESNLNFGKRNAGKGKVR